MDKLILRYIGLFVFLLFLQLFIFNNIQLSGYINPYVYILFILLLPYDTPGWLLLVIGFATGLVVDLFMNTLGFHSSATLFMAFVRYHLLNFLTEKDSNERITSPSMQNNGVVWFLRYASILIVAHHLFLFMLESFSLFSFFATLVRVFLSSIITLLVIFALQFFTIRR